MTQIKLCGLFRPVDVVAANAAAPEFAGFVFANSHRQISLAQAQNFRKKLNPTIITVGVFVDAPLTEMLAAVNSGAISYVQLHGHETETMVDQLQQAGAKVIQVFNLTQTTYQPTQADAVMFDAGKGTGETFDWTQVPQNVPQPVFLAGGITVANVTAAIQTVHPTVIDVSSGIETGGLKDPQKMRQLTQLVHDFNE
ncbi:phosphoribosylanthranilate isomerase [Loigolactobacillus bifermentans]|uniref:N-(5'-phosphoribosyl)anthranilate isomerase n=1 Tax=Loigolactobacillus bifermentans DSM 20003 TaxID=1423726 RepID=A0A0R1GKY9_9LACO|nr:phosphoribosylanthranilate isomerase [Loigolactobacillus bifermentans]KRK34670.1 N-(5-phosphoribosyl)anthranilate isomerase [Loigolactobacillus bifermentans DSM 20003]QGG61064.1 phosphoribosylanthranilate isomerase [Loigolactobacillus bifermentans]